MDKCLGVDRLDASSEGASVAVHDGSFSTEVVGVASKDAVKEKEVGGDGSEGGAVATLTKPSPVHSSTVLSRETEDYYENGGASI